MYGEQAKKSAPSTSTSTGACAVKCTPSTYTRAPASWARAAIDGTAGRVPIRLDAAVTATSLVRSDSAAATFSIGSSPVVGSKSTHRTTAPTDCAASTQGRMFAS